MKLSFAGLHRLESRLGRSTANIAAVAVYVFLGLAALASWGVTGDLRWVDRYFQLPGAILFVWLAATELWLCLRVCRHFSAGETLRSAWVLIAFSAGCGLVGAFYTQILGVDSPLNPLRYLPGWGSGSADLSARQAGLFLGGTCRLLLLAAGLAYVLRAYRRQGFLGRLTAVEKVLLGAVAVCVAGSYWDVYAGMRAGRRPPLAEMLGWPVGPALWLLLADALLIRRSVLQLGAGWVGKCWGAYSAGILLATLGNVGLWAIGRDYIQWPWAALTWYVWLPAAVAFALGPAYQLEAIQQAHAWHDGARASRDGA